MVKPFERNLIYATLVMIFLAPSITLAQNPTQGILLLAHGGAASWNEEVLKIAKQVDQRIPVEVAFGMAAKRTIQEAADRLMNRGVQRITAVPLFVSSHSSVVTSTEYLLGLRAVAPPELARYAKMDHGAKGDAHHSDHAPDGFDPMKPIQSSAPVSITAALGRHALVSDILLSRANALSRVPENEVVIVVAHGPVSDDENAKWLADMEALVGPLNADHSSEFHRVEYMTVRDDAREPIRSRATAELRSRVEKASGEGKRVLIVPLLLSFGGIEQGIHKRLEGLRYEMSPQALLPDDRIVQWVLLQAGIR